MAEVSPQLQTLHDAYLVKHGWDRSLTAGPVDAAGVPIPWITYPAIEMLKQISAPDFRVFEFGCGNSSLWWAARSKEVVSVDHDEGWIKQLSLQKPANLTLIHRPLGAVPNVPPSPAIAKAIELMARDQILAKPPKERDNVVHGLNIHDFGGYAATLTEWPQAYFDVIVVDGMARSLCAYLAGLWVKPHGIVVFDNTDRGQYSPGFEALRDLGFGRIDFFGPGPVRPDETCTSIFVKEITVFRNVPVRDKLIDL